MNPLMEAVHEATTEYDRAAQMYASFPSAHHGMDVLREELEELQQEVRKRPNMRDLTLMRKEAIQLAAMALRFATDVAHDGGPWRL